MTLETVVSEKLNRYRDDEIMLDALLQWASNPTSMSAGYGLEENYPYIAKNLTARHGISRSEAEKRVAELRNVCGLLEKEADRLGVAPRYRIGEIQRALGEALGQEPLQGVLRQGVLRRLREVSEETRRALLTFVLLERAGWTTPSPEHLTQPPGYYADPQSEFQAFYTSLFGETAPVVRVVDELVRGGTYNELYYIPSTGKTSPRPRLVKGVSITQEEIEAIGTRLPPDLEIPALLESYWSGGYFDVLRVIDIVSHSYRGVWRSDEALPPATNLRGFIGTHGQHVALSPKVGAATLHQVDVTKSARMEDIRRRVENALVSVAQKFGPDAALGVLWTGMGEVLWEFELTGSPPFYVYLAPWLTTFTQSPGLSRINLSEKPHVLFVIPYQSRPSIQSCLERISGFSLKDTRWEKSLGLLSDPQKPQEFQLLVGQRHRLLDATLAELAGREPVQPLRPTPPEPPPAPAPAPPPLAPPPPTPYAVTFPPYAQGNAVVFGRGLLKDKIALGFFDGKEPAPENIVAWNIHSVYEPFICTFQQIGMGKSTLASCIMLQAAFQGIPVVVFDPKPDYVANLVPVQKTIEKFPDFADPISDRFKSAKQDLRGFDLSRPLEFEYEGKTLRLRYQVFSFSPEIQKLGGRPLKMPLVVLPPLSDPMFKEICDSVATSVATALHRQWQQQAYNTTLSAVFRRFRQQHPAKDYLLPSDLERELEEEADAAADKAEKRRLGNLVRALRGYCTAQSWLYAATEDEVAKPDDLVQNPGYEGADGKTVTITVLDLSRLPQERRNPARMNYVSNVCGYLYNLVGRRRSSRPAQFLLVMDEAANYLPDPTDQFNQTLTIIRQGRSLGIRVWLIAQAPGQIEIQARNQAFMMVLSQIPAHAIRPELTRWQPDECWTQKLAQTDRGRALVVDKLTASQGGILTQLFTSPQTINLLNTDQILELLS